MYMYTSDYTYVRMDVYLYGCVFIWIFVFCMYTSDSTYVSLDVYLYGSLYFCMYTSDFTYGTVP
jgi:hypothetical protein